MSKMFFDVFPTLEVNGEIKKLLSETEVIKVGMNREQTRLRIYILSMHLIHKKNIYTLEKSIREQIFKGKEIEVKIIEKYKLSEQYNARTLWDIYKESMLEELKQFSLMEYNLLRTAKMEFTDDTHLNLTIENTIIAQTRATEIVEFLEKIVCERCGMDLQVNLIYEEPKESKYKKNSELQLQQEIQNIVRRVNNRLEEEAVSNTKASLEKAQKETEAVKAVPKTEKSIKSEAKPAGEKAIEKFGEKSGEKAMFTAEKTTKKPFESNRKEFRRKSDNPDVIYGRDMDDREVIPIEKIVDEMGEVTIRCKIMTLDTREIRNEKTIVILSVTDFTDSIVVKIFTKTEDCKELLPELKPGAFVKIRGVTTIDKFDSELTIGSIVSIKKIPNFGE